MPRLSTTYVCQQCGYSSPQFLGRCPECDSWGSLVEQVTSSVSSAKSKTSARRLGTSEVIEIANINKEHYQRFTTTFEEFDRVLGGGVVVGSINLISGDPGIGKSTLLTQLAINIKDTLYVAGEESAHQIKIRADRINPKAELSVLNEVDVDVITGVIENLKPKLVIIDSIQTLQTGDLESVAGSVSQVRESAHRLQMIAKALHVPIFLVGHVTKEGTVAGPRTLEHLVDVVLSLEGENTSNFRILRASKNRFGPTDEVGIFEMEGVGLKQVSNPSQIFLEQKVDAPGSVVVPTMNGLRPILVEIQALVTKSFLPSPRRTGSGVDNNRLQLLVAVLQKRMGLPLYDQDIFVNVTGGLKVYEPAVDLGICMAITSSLKDKTIKPKTVLVGEVGLLGELRNIKNLDRRATEAKKLGFTNVISPQNAKNLSDAIKLALSS
jgi:DNA repair protein RadA/Sms